MTDFIFICVRDTILITILIIISIKDLREYLIPDKWVVIAIVNWFAWALVLGDGFGAIIMRMLAAVVIAGTLLVVVIFTDRIMGKESLGGGDIKLLFAITLYLGTWDSLYMMLIACIIGLVLAVIIKNRESGGNRYFPFGPAMSLATVIMLTAGGFIDRLLG